MNDRSRKIPMARAGYSLIEVVVATAIVGLLLVAAMNTIGASLAGQINNAERRFAGLIASEMLAEITQLPFADPDGGTGLGPDTGEDASGDRSAFDDVDDYADWNSSPPEDKQGNPLPNVTALTRNVTVKFVKAADFQVTVGANEGVKRITVTVTGHGVTLATLTTVVVDR